MDQFTNAIGIDVSKLTLDAHDYVNGLRIQVSNTTSGFRELIQWTRKSNKDLAAVVFCFEHTGIYSLPLSVYLAEHQVKYALVPGLEVKLSSGLSRGKNDQVDAQRIAEYAFLRRHKIILYQLPSKDLLQLKSLISLREKMVSQRAGYKASKKEMKSFLRVVKPSSVIFEAQEQIVEELNKQIKKVEKQIKALIDQDKLRWSGFAGQLLCYFENRAFSMSNKFT